MDLVREAARWAVAVGSLVAVGSVSTARYLANGPMVHSWDQRTQLSRDLIRFMVTSSADHTWHVLGQTCHEYWPDIAQLLRPPQHVSYEQLSIPAYPLSAQSLQSAGIWRGALARVADASAAMHMAAERVVPASAESAVVLYVHGGAYTSGSARQYREVHARMARATRLPVIGFSYRLAPAAQYPVQLYDAYCAYAHVRSMGYEDAQIVLAGDSAGGNLVLALWQLVRMPARALVLLSPRVDVTSARQSWSTFAGVDVLRAYAPDDSRSSIWQLLGHGTDERARQLLADPFVAPVNADLHGLPPTLVQAGSAEVMLDDIREFVRRARRQRADVELQLFDDMFHVFQAALPGTRNLAAAWDAIGAFCSQVSRRV
ncbi:hypothetical protein IWW51_005389 [Coemansia sp. RSA 2702]|nr:hypothetical protein IWW51_005389 [Coemansia sp. RSA 2702]KAJ2717435.1 hypothetical protein H4R23_005315 [Coemansia sp. Cherry 401B]